MVVVALAFFITNIIIIKGTIINHYEIITKCIEIEKTD